MFAALVVLFTAGMMSHENERHQYAWNSLRETAEAEFSENDAPFAGVIIVAKDFVWYAAQAFAVLCAGLLIVYLVGKWGVGVVLAGILWYVFRYPVHSASDIALLFPIVGGAAAGLWANRNEVGNVTDARRSEWHEQCRQVVELEKRRLLITQQRT